MAEPFVVVVPHQIGREAARRRIERGLGQLGTAFGGHVKKIDARWTADHLDFKAEILGQAIAAKVDVGDGDVRLEASLPWVLAKLGGAARGFIENQGKQLLQTR